jgi:diaminopimelate decarboxylase
MSPFVYKKNTLYCEDVDLTTVAQQYGTPCYVYSRAALEDNMRAYLSGFASAKFRVCYAVKANSNIAILNLFARANMGFDIVSLGELERVIAAKGDPKKIIFSGVGKRSDEIARAIEMGVGCFDIESEAELQRINDIANQLNVIVNIALRINPNVDARTHPHISTGLNENKFGIDLDDVLNLCAHITVLPKLKLTGLAFHIGSQLTELEPILTAVDCVLALVNELANRGIHLKHLNIGGGLGVIYQNESPPTISAYLAALDKKFEHCSLEIILEPGRSLVANTGVLLTRVEYLKLTPHKNFAIVDAAMNDLIRPALYDAWHEIKPVNQYDGLKMETYDIVGPVCETADCLGKDRLLAIQADDYLAICTAGAYGFCMSSNYNSRPRPPEVMIDKDQVHLIRARENITELYATERLLID